MAQKFQKTLKIMFFFCSFSSFWWFLGPRTIGNESLVKNKYSEKIRYQKNSSIFQKLHFWHQKYFFGPEKLCFIIKSYFSTQNHWFSSNFIIFWPIFIIFWLIFINLSTLGSQKHNKKTGPPLHDKKTSWYQLLF